MRATLIRDLVETDHSGEHAVRRTQSVEVEIVFPERLVSDVSGYITYGEWRLAEPIPQLVR
jgi:hypothetical protein